MEPSAALRPTTLRSKEKPVARVKPPRSANGSRKLGDILVEMRYVNADQLDRALSYQKENGARLGEALVKLGYITEDHLAEAIASQKRLPVIPLGEILPNPRATALLSEKFVRSRQVLPIDFDRDALVVAMVNPLDVVTLDDVRVITGYEIVPAVVTATAFTDTVEYLYSGRGSLGSAPEDRGATAVDIAEDRRVAEDVSVVTLVDDILDTALKRRASDVHFEPQLYEMPVRMRIDGVLHHVTEIPNHLKGGVLSRIKIMGDMDIAEKRLPQDGRATYRSDEQTVDLRIASIPTVYGENITIRLLDETMFEITLEELGLGEAELVVFRRALNRPYGQILITGPTGSGKSTTLYSALAEINSPTVKIYTVEDPVERKMPGILQSQIKSSIGLTFAAALRSLVRSDPDVIMVGEIRDLETATIATEAALTGHLVMSTLHTNDAASTITRLVEMRVPPFLIASALECVVAQRLARKLCPHCKREVTLVPAGMTAMEFDLFGDTPVAVAKAVGCRRCYGTGYSGRVGLYEVLPVTKELKSMISDAADTDAIRDYAIQEGMATLRQDGKRKILRKLTTVDEVQRVTM
ncbi:MAG: Flp pilus assembly complex ATPase component TadA [Actinobacteria bacterium]|nr:Flp pilus assembly complex ATPase component TadA [Actinomycetota bacterium]